MSHPRCIGILVVLCATLLVSTADRTVSATPGEMFPIDIVLVADYDILCVNHVDLDDNPWFIADVASVHPDLPPLPFPQGTVFRVTGTYCVDCVHTFCGTFVGFIFNANIMPSLDADLDIDGDVDVADLLDMLSAWGPCPGTDPCSADLNGDLQVSVPDLLALLSTWS